MRTKYFKEKYFLDYNLYTVYKSFVKIKMEPNGKVEKRIFYLSLKD